MISAVRTVTLTPNVAPPLAGSPPPPALRWPDKAALATQDYSLDVTSDLIDPDTVASFVVRYGATVQVVDCGATGNVITIWLAGGQVGAYETVGFVWKTVTGRQGAASVGIAVTDQGSYSADVITDGAGPVWDSNGTVLTVDPSTLQWTASEITDDVGRSVNP